MSISKEFLETLLIDRALGELSPEAGALIDAYLEKDPAAAEEARQISATLSLAKQALTPKSRVTLPPLRSPVVVSMPRTVAPPRRWMWPTALAATLALGFFIGAISQPKSLSSLESAAVQVNLIHSPAVNSAPENDGLAKRPSFWSRDSFLARHAESGKESLSSLEWDSPVRRPQRRMN